MKNRIKLIGRCVSLSENNKRSLDLCEWATRHGLPGVSRAERVRRVGEVYTGTNPKIRRPDAGYPVDGKCPAAGYPPATCKILHQRLGGYRRILGFVLRWRDGAGGEKRYDVIGGASPAYTCSSL